MITGEHLCWLCLKPTAFYRVLLALSFNRALPAGHRNLLAARYSELAGRGIFGDRTACAYRATCSDRHWRNKLCIGTDKYVILYNCAVFVGAVVVASDSAGADVDLVPEAAVAQISKVIGLGAISHLRRFDFDEIPYSNVVGQASAGPQTRVWSDAATCAHGGVVNVRKRQDFTVVTNVTFTNDAVGANRRSIAKHDIPFEYAANVNCDIPSTR